MKIILIAIAAVSAEFSCWTCAVQNEVILILFIETTEKKYKNFNKKYEANTAIHSKWCEY